MPPVSRGLVRCVTDFCVLAALLLLLTLDGHGRLRSPGGTEPRLHEQCIGTRTRVGAMTVVLVVAGYFAAMTVVVWVIGVVTGGDTTAG
jgi:hypothetical protein